MDKFVLKNTTTCFLDRSLIKEERKIVDDLHDKYWSLRRKKKYAENHIFDEEKSVRWNKEEVIRQNEKIDDEIKRANDDYSKANDKFQAFLVNHVFETYGFTKEMIKVAWDKAYEQSHSYGFNEVVETFEEYLDFSLEMITLSLK